MKKSFYFLTSILTFVGIAEAQVSCVTMTCPNSFTQAALTNSCSTIVNYSAPIVINNCAGAAASQTFAFTGATQTFVVPSGVTSVTIETWGAQGGANWVNNVNFGGYNKGVFTVAPSQTLEIRAGGQPTTGTSGGFNGGGAGDGAGKGGGGASDVRIAPYTLNDRIIVSGGGGGAGYWSSLHVVGGIGGGLNGGDGYRNTPADAGGAGATQTGPGAFGTCITPSNTAMTGTFGIGGNASAAACGCEGYGGGGGWYGGAGSGNCRGGGGGSGYILPSATATAAISGTNTGNGKVVISYASTATATTSLVSGLASGTVFPIGTTVQTFSTVTNNSNTASCSFSVTVLDVTIPVITCPSDMLICTLTNSVPVNVTSLLPVSVVDNCTTSVTFTRTGVTTGTGVNTANGLYNLGVTNIIYKATDAAGNFGTCPFSVTVGIVPSLTIASSSSIICSGQSATLNATGATSYTWNGGANTNTIVVSPTATAIYTVNAIGQVSNCAVQGTVMQTVSPCLGLKETSLSENNLQILPNPNKGIFTLLITQNGQVKITNAIGQLILNENKSAGEHTINLSEYAKGIYTIQIESAEGTSSKKMVIE
jgi:hypothetical protein